MTRRDAGRPRGQAVVDAVLDAVLDELAATGRDGVSVEKVARRAQVNKTSVYRRWHTRDELITAALGRAAQAIAELPDQGSLRGDLLAITAAVAGLLAQPEGRALARAAVADDAVPPGRAFGREVPPLVARADRRGEWRPDVDAGVLTSLLVGAVWHRVLVERASADEAWQEAVVDLLVRAVRR